MRRLLILLIDFYRVALSPMKQFIGGPGCGCRFEPSCSMFAREAVLQHGPYRGGILAVRRIMRCHPWGGCGYDPVPKTLNSHS